jgi:peptidoglycan hydrolase-like protein with peptidoglycan-binding domain
MRTLTAYWIGVVIVLAVLNGIRALPPGSRARRSMRNMGIAAAVLGSLAIAALKWGSQNANSPSTPDAQQINTVSTTPDDIMQVQVRLVELGYMIGPPDGLWGNKSRQALRAFKAANGIQADDKWDSEISAKLFSTQAARSPIPSRHAPVTAPNPPRPPARTGSI